MIIVGDGCPHYSKCRVCTVVYGKTPTIGGATAFTKSNIYVKPVAGSVTFFRIEIKRLFKN